MLKVWLYFAQSFVAVLLTVATAVVTAQSAGDIVPGKWFVEFHGEQPNAVSISRQRFRTRLAKLPLKTRIIHEFDIWPGVVVDVTSSNRVQFMRSLLEMTFIKRVTPVRYVAPHTSTHPQLDTAPLLSTMAAANITPAPLNSHYTGSGIRVGIVDSGIDAMHPALTGLVKHGWDFIADSEPSSSRNETACMSHGTHVAGIIAMRDVNSRGLAGIAPGVTLGSYRIFGCPSSRTGSSFSISGGSGGGSVVTSEDLVLAAMNRAFKDGMHVLNLSLGGGSSWSESPVAAAASLLR
ncbi:subtilisin-like protein [Ramicandelaber brevisporus]|nr:subtilisin-like protein [Ramicandelaber brevisporus]